ncbi:MAG TPA: type IV pilus assembly protein PilM [bacterium]|nr:type IV pilus assembly protein PilM [bacterium]
MSLIANIQSYFNTSRIIGLDIGENTVKLVELEKSHGSVRLVRYALIPVNGHAASGDADISKVHLIGARMREFARDIPAGGLSCVVGISGQSVFLRFVKLPAVEKKKMDQIIRFEAQQQVPFPIEEVRWDYQLLGKLRKDERDILLVAIKQDIVRAMVEAVCEAGLMPEVVDVLPLSLYNCTAFNGLQGAEPTLVIDTGAKTTSLIVTEGHDLWVRSIPIAGNSITQCVAEDCALGFADAEQKKIETGIAAPDAPGASKAAAAVDRGVSRLFAEISRSLGFYKSQYGGSPIQKILITGGGALLKNFDAALTERFKIPVERIDPFKKIAIAVADPKQRERLAADRDLLASAVGLGLRELGKTPLAINLIPQDILRMRMIVRKFVYFAASFVTVILSLGLIHFYCMRIVSANDIRCRDLSTFITHLEVLNNHAKSTLDRVAGINNRLNIVSQLLEGRSLWMRLFIEIQKVMAPDIWVVNISGTLDDFKTDQPRPVPAPPSPPKAGKPKPQGEIKQYDKYSVVYIEGKGTGSIETDIPRFRDALEKSPMFKEVSIVSAEMSDGVVTFVIKLTMEKGFLR